MPKLVETYRKHRDRGFETIAVAMSYDPPNYVIHYAEKNALPFKVALDPVGDIARQFGDVRLTPTTFVIDRRGIDREALCRRARLRGARRADRGEARRGRVS